MNFLGILGSGPGQYVTQSVLHALVAGSVAEMAIRSWNVRKPSLRQKYHLLAIVFPVFSYPVFQLLSPDRGSVQFRLGALFDSGRWLYLELPGGIPAGALFAGALAIVSLIFLLQEFVPIARNAFRSGGSDLEGITPPGENPKVLSALEELPAEKADVFVLDESDLVIFSSTGLHSSIYVSSGLVGALSVEQLRAALAHEFAHVVRSRRPLLIAVYLLRIVMFFNPVVLVAFRRAAQEDEKICDEMAAAATGKPRVLAETLRMLYMPSADAAPEDGENPSQYLRRLESYSHRMEIEGRIEQLEADEAPGTQGRWFGLASAVLAAAAISYFIV